MKRLVEQVNEWRPAYWPVYNIHSQESMIFGNVLIYVIAFVFVGGRCEDFGNKIQLFFVLADVSQQSVIIMVV